MNQVEVIYKYEEDMASTKDLLTSHAHDEHGKLTEEHVWTPEEGEGKRTATFEFPTHYLACWFIAKLASEDYVLGIEAVTTKH